MMPVASSCSQATTASFMLPVTSQLAPASSQVTRLGLSISGPECPVCPDDHVMRIESLTFLVTTPGQLRIDW